MHPASAISVFIRSALRRGWLACVLMLLGLFVAGAAHAGATYQFAGADKVLGCSLSGNVYTCSALQLPNWDDKAVIASGYTVAVQSDVSFGYNHGLTMSGTARLTSTGSINLSGLNPSNVLVSGGSFSAGGAFAVTGANPFKADVDAASITLGTGSRLELGGNMVARGAISIGSNTTFTGSLSGTTIGTESPVTLNASIVATASFTLASGSTVKGNITAPEVQLNAAGSVVTGNVTASTSLTMGSSVRIKGAVDTGKLTMQASDATIEGPAAVESAVLFWGGRVTERITCKKGTSANKCDCVDNQSGYPTNSANGPKCEAARPAPSGLDHFLIVHDGSAGTCSTKAVEVTACADAACTQKYANTTQVTLQPGNATASITGSGTADVSSALKGTNILSLTTGATKPTVKCRNRQTGATDCKMEFTGDASFNVEVGNHNAGNEAKAIITAMKPNDNASACVPAFSGAKTVTFSCSYTRPASGDQLLKLAGRDLQCGGTNAIQHNLTFDGKAQASLGLTYGDAGKLKLSAASGEIKGSGEFIVAPDSFAIAYPPALRAGQDFKVDLTALNSKGEVTKNFHKLGFANPAEAKTVVSMVCNAHTSGMQPIDATFQQDKASATLNFPEAGYIGLKAELNNFLGSGLAASGQSGMPSSLPCPATVGPFVPMYFQVELDDASRAKSENGKDISFYYAREPMPLRISAMNAQGAVTADYAGAWGGDHLFNVSAADKDGKPLPTTTGKLSATLKASDFSKGVARLLPSAASPQPVFQFDKALTMPTRIRVRVDNGATANLDPNHRITSEDADAYKARVPEKARPEIRTGRLRIAATFGRAGSTLTLPVTAEYWSGKSWLLNSLDDFTAIPAAAIAQSAHAPAGSTAAAPAKQNFPAFKLAGGKLAGGKSDKLQIQSATAGWIDIAFNLGSAALDQSCLSAHPPTVGANMPWLQAGGGCADPSGRATIGIFSPENKRVIHVREVFN